MSSPEEKEAFWEGFKTAFLALFACAGLGLMAFSVFFKDGAEWYAMEYGNKMDRTSMISNHVNEKHKTYWNEYGSGPEVIYKVENGKRCAYHRVAAPEANTILSLPEDCNQ